jgi:hypothetical protein
METTAIEAEKARLSEPQQWSSPVAFVERVLELGELTAETPTLFLIHLQKTSTEPNGQPLVVRLTVTGPIASFICFQQENANWNVPYSQQNALFHELNHIETIQVPAAATETVPVIVQVKAELVRQASLQVQRIQATLVASLWNGDVVATLPITGRVVRSVLAFALDSRPETNLPQSPEAFTEDLLPGGPTEGSKPDTVHQTDPNEDLLLAEEKNDLDEWRRLDRALVTGASTACDKTLTIEVPMLQATGAKDVLLWNRCELATQFGLQIYPNDNHLTCTDLDSGLALGPGPHRLGGLQCRRLRFAFTATKAGHFSYTIRCTNWRNPGNHPVLHILCLSGIQRPATLALFRVVQKDAAVDTGEIDFGDVYAGSTVSRELLVQNCLANASIVVSMDQELAARYAVTPLATMEIPAKEEHTFRLNYQPPLGTQTTIAAVDGRFLEKHFSVAFQVSTLTRDDPPENHDEDGSIAAPTTATTETLVTSGGNVAERSPEAAARLWEQRALSGPETSPWGESIHRSGTMGSGLVTDGTSTTESPEHRAGSSRSSSRFTPWTRTFATQPASSDGYSGNMRNLTGEEETIAPGLGQRERASSPLASAAAAATTWSATVQEGLTAVRPLPTSKPLDPSSRLQRKVFRCRARVCESIVRVHPTEIHLGDCYIESLHTAYIQLMNVSDLPAFLAVRFSSTSVSVASLEPIIGPRQTYDLRIDFTPHRVNPDYSKQITLLNLRNPRNEHVVVIRANCVDRFRVLYHALFYRLATDRSTHVNELDYGTMVAGHDYIRAFQVRNLTDKRLVLGFELPKRPRVELLVDPQFCEHSVPVSADMEHKLSVQSWPTTGSVLGGGAQCVGRDRGNIQALPPSKSDALSYPANLRSPGSIPFALRSPEGGSVIAEGDQLPALAMEKDFRQTAGMLDAPMMPTFDLSPREHTQTSGKDKTRDSPSVSMVTGMLQQPEHTQTSGKDKTRDSPSVSMVTGMLQQPEHTQTSGKDEDALQVAATNTPSFQTSRCRPRCPGHGPRGASGPVRFGQGHGSLSQASTDSEDWNAENNEMDELWGSASPVSARKNDLPQQLLRTPTAMPSFFSSSEAEADYIHESLRPARVLQHARASGCLQQTTQLVMEANAEAMVYVVIQFDPSDRRLRTKLRPFEDRLYLHLVDYDQSRLPTGQAGAGCSLPPRELVLRGRVCISRMEVAQPHINFGPILAGEQRAKTLLLQNTSEMPAFYAIRKSGSVDSDYLHFGSDRQGVLRPFSAKEVPFVFRPSFHGLFEECVWMVNLLDPSDTHPVTMKAVVRRRTHFLVRPLSLDFGLVHLEDQVSPGRLCWITNQSDRRRLFVIEQDAADQETMATALLALDGIEPADAVGLGTTQLEYSSERCSTATTTTTAVPWSTHGNQSQANVDRETSGSQDAHEGCSTATTTAVPWSTHGNQSQANADRETSGTPPGAVPPDERSSMPSGSEMSPRDSTATTDGPATTAAIGTTTNTDPALEALEQKLRIAERKGKTEKVERLRAEIAQRRARASTAVQAMARSMTTPPVYLKPVSAVEHPVSEHIDRSHAGEGVHSTATSYREAVQRTHPLSSRGSFQVGRLLFGLAGGQTARLAVLLQPHARTRGRQHLKLSVFEQKNRDEQQCIRCLLEVPPAFEQAKDAVAPSTSTKSQHHAASSPKVIAISTRDPRPTTSAIERSPPGLMTLETNTLLGDPTRQLSAVPTAVTTGQRPVQTPPSTENVALPAAADHPRREADSGRTRSASPRLVNVSPTVIDFGRVPVGLTATCRLTIQNTSDRRVSFSVLEDTQVALPATLLWGPMRGTIDVHGVAQIRLTFRPDRIGALARMLVVTVWPRTPSEWSSSGVSSWRAARDSKVMHQDTAGAAGTSETVRLRVQGLALARRALYLPQLESRPSMISARSSIAGVESAELQRPELPVLRWAFGDVYMDPDQHGLSAIRALEVVSLSNETLLFGIRSNLAKQIFFFHDENAQKPLAAAVRLAPGATCAVQVGVAPRMPLGECWAGAVRELVAGLQLTAWTDDRGQWPALNEEALSQAAVVDTLTIKLQARVGFTFPLLLRALEILPAVAREPMVDPEQSQQTCWVPLWPTARFPAGGTASATGSGVVPGRLQPPMLIDRSPSWLLDTAWYWLDTRRALAIRNPNAGLPLRLQVRRETMHYCGGTKGHLDDAKQASSSREHGLVESAVTFAVQEVVIPPLAEERISYEWRVFQSGLYLQRIRLENSAYPSRAFDLQLVLVHSLSPSRPMRTVPVPQLEQSEPCLVSVSTAKVLRPGLWRFREAGHLSTSAAALSLAAELQWRLYVHGFPVRWRETDSPPADSEDVEQGGRQTLAEPHPDALYWASAANELSYRLIPSLLHEEEWSALLRGALVCREALLVANLQERWLCSLPVHLRYGCALLALESETVSVGRLGYVQGNVAATVVTRLRNVGAVATRWRVQSATLPAGVDVFLGRPMYPEAITAPASEKTLTGLEDDSGHATALGTIKRQRDQKHSPASEADSSSAAAEPLMTPETSGQPDLSPSVGWIGQPGSVCDPTATTSTPSDGDMEATVSISAHGTTYPRMSGAQCGDREGASETVEKQQQKPVAKTDLSTGQEMTLDAGATASLYVVLHPTAMNLAAGPFQLPIIIENIFQPDNRLTLRIQGVYTVRLISEVNPVYLNEQGQGILSIAIPEAAQGDVQVHWNIELATDGPYTQMRLQDRASGATLRSLTLASGEKFELQAVATTSSGQYVRTGLAPHPRDSAADTGSSSMPTRDPVAWIELLLRRKQDAEASPPERIPVYDSSHASHPECLSPAALTASHTTDALSMEKDTELALSETAAMTSLSRRPAGLGDSKTAVEVAETPAMMSHVPLSARTNSEAASPQTPAAINDDDPASRRKMASAVALQGARGQAPAVSGSVDIDSSPASCFDPAEDDAGPQTFRLHGCARVGAHLFELDAGMVPLGSQAVQRTLVIAQRLGSQPLTPAALSKTEAGAGSTSVALEYKLHRIPTHWRRQEPEQGEWLTLNRMGGIIEPSRASQQVTLTMNPHRLGLFREYLLLTDRHAPANLALIRVGMEVVAERSDASTIFQTSPLAIDYGAVMLHHVYRNKSIRIRNLSDQPLEFLLRHDLSPRASSELHFSTSNLALRKVTSVWVDKGSSRRVFLYFCPEPDGAEQTSKVSSRTFHLFVSCRLVRDYEECVEIRCVCHPPQLRISTNDISFTLSDVSAGAAPPTANLRVETLVPSARDLYEVRSLALFFTVTEHEPGVLCIQPRLEAIAELAPDEKYIEEHCSVYNRRRPREFFWIRLRIKVGGDAVPEFSAALPRKRVFVLEEIVSRFLCQYAAFWSSYRRPRTPGAGTDSMHLAVAAGERGAEDLVSRLRARQRWQDHDEREPLALWVERIRQATGVAAAPHATESHPPDAYAALIFEAHYCTDELVFYALRDQSDTVLQLALTCYSYVFKYDVFQVYMRGDEAIVEALAPVVKFWYGQLRHFLSFFPDSERSDRLGLRAQGPLHALGQLAATEWSRTGGKPS